jgi:cellulose synthase operon protein C
MSWRSLILACALGASSVAAQQPYPLANEELLHSARSWEARDRGDLARLALEKLVAARPDSPAALLELGELHLRMADVPAAQRVLEQLNTRFKGSPDARTFATALRVATRDRLQLASVQRLIQLGQGAAAKAALDKLFPDGAPDGTSAIEYYRLLARTPGGWERARDGLRSLAARRADDPRYRLALARHLLSREASELEGLQILHELAQRDDIREREVANAFSAAISSLGYQRVPANILRAYSARHPDDANAARLLEQRLRIEQEAQLLLRLADSAANPAEQRGNLLELRAALLGGRATNSSFEHALAVQRALRGVPHGGDSRFDATTRAALKWARRSIESATDEPARAAIEKNIAVAFAGANFEQAIALAKQLQALGAHGEAEELLATARELDPQSSWLFETQVRALLDRGDIEAALQLLEGRPVDARWTAAARDELLTTALDRRAEAALAAGDTARARSDLERAIHLQPTNPWTRYRLAGLLARDGEPDAGRALLRDGVSQSPGNPEMRYAQALYLASIDDYAAALASVDSIPSAQRSASMVELHGRARSAVARSEAQSRAQAGDRSGARAALNSVEALAAGDLDRARQLANAWLDLGDTAQALRVLDLYQRGHANRDSDVLLARAEILHRVDDPRLVTTLEQLRTQTDLTPVQRAELARLERAAQLSAIRALQREGRFDAAAARLDALLAEQSNDRELRIARAELEASAGRPRSARDLYAALVAENPDDLDTRLAYARALTDSNDRELARLQLQNVVERASPTDVELQLSIARRQLALGDADAATATVERVLAVAPERTDALLLAGRARLLERDFAGARNYFDRAEHGVGSDVQLQARAARAAIDARRQHWMESGFESRHKPGDAGVSQFDALIVPTLWSYGYDYERRLTLRADAVSVDAGSLSADFDTAALLGSVQAAGPAAPRPYRNGTQQGMSLGLIYATDAFSADLGTTPLGFLLPNIVGGVVWSPDWRGIDFALGIDRRAVTSSVLSYAGMRDPISGREWGGVVATGPYVEAGWYREFVSVSGTLRYSQLEGTNVLDNGFIGVRGAADWKFWSRPQWRAFIGAVVNYWAYDHNQQNYTFGSGGYYSPESYVSLSIPLEVHGEWRDWSYRVRASLSYSDSTIARAPFYPTDAALQAAAANAPLPSGFDSPYFENDDGGGTSLSGYAAVERQLLPGLVMGAKLDIDRADYYEPTIVMLYVRHVFGDAPTPVARPPRPASSY